MCEHDDAFEVLMRGLRIERFQPVPTPPPGPLPGPTAEMMARQRFDEMHRETK